MAEAPNCAQGLLGRRKGPGSRAPAQSCPNAPAAARRGCLAAQAPAALRCFGSAGACPTVGAGAHPLRDDPEPASAGPLAALQQARAGKGTNVHVCSRKIPLTWRFEMSGVIRWHGRSQRQYCAPCVMCWVSACQDWLPVAASGGGAGASLISRLGACTGSATGSV